MVRVTGEIDMANASDLTDFLSSLTELHDLLAVDLSKVEFIDSTGLTALIRTYKLLEPGGSFLLLAPSPAVSRVLKATGLDGLFRISAAAEPPEALVQLIAG